MAFSAAVVSSYSQSSECEQTTHCGKAGDEAGDEECEAASGAAASHTTTSDRRPSPTFHRHPSESAVPKSGSTYLVLASRMMVAYAMKLCQEEQARALTRLG